MDKDSVRQDAFLVRTLSRFSCKCPHVNCLYNASPSPPWISIGANGNVFLQHLKECLCATVKCPDCNQSMVRSELLEVHRPSNQPCKMAPIYCHACKINIPRVSIEEHALSSGHTTACLRQASSFINQHLKATEEFKELTDSIVETRNELCKTNASIRTHHDELELVAINAEERINKKIEETKHDLLNAFVEFEIKKWSEMKAGVAVFSEDTPLRVWGVEFWLKVQKDSDKIQLFLCYGDTRQVNHPVQVDYQLMVKKRSSDDGVCRSTLFRTVFGKEKAWGLSKFATQEKIEREGAYSHTEDIVTFGCWISPVKGLVWPCITPTSSTVSSTPPTNSLGRQ